MFVFPALPPVVQDILMNLAKAVANAAAMLVLKAKNVAQVAEDTVLQNRVIAAATQCALSTSQLVACAKVREHVCWTLRGYDLTCPSNKTRVLCE